MNPNINLINPFHIYTGKDLYNYGRYGATNYNFIRRHKKFLEKIGVGENFLEDTFLHEMSVTNLNLLTILTLDRLKEDKFLNCDTLSHTRKFVNANIVAFLRECYLNNLKHKESRNDTVIDMFKLKDLNLDNFKSIQDFNNIKIGSIQQNLNLEVYVNTKNLKTVDPLCIINDISKYRGNIKFSYLYARIPMGTPLRYMLTLNGSYYVNLPFRENSTYPIVNSSDLILYKNNVSLKDLLSLGDPNKCSGYLRYVNKIRKEVYPDIEDTSLFEKTLIKEIHSEPTVNCEIYRVAKSACNNKIYENLYNLYSK